jgi:hypothetical protein
MKILSGGQTGVDRAALDAALDLGVSCGGYCPLGRKAEDGAIPKKYPLQTLASARYRDRTLKNLLEAEATIIFFNKAMRGGTQLTAQMCRKNNKRFISIDADHLDQHKAADLLQSFIDTHHPDSINVAGPRKSQWPGGYDYAYQVLHTVLTTRMTSISAGVGN